jgi:hypothetical protein
MLRDFLDNFCSVYLDNILVYSELEKEHIEHCTKVLTCLKKAGLYLDIRKSNFYIT